METNFVKDIELICFCLHPDLPYIFYLKQDYNHKCIYLVQEELFNGLQVSCQIIPKDQDNNKYKSSFKLVFSKKKSYIGVVYPSSQLVIIDSQTNQNLFSCIIKGKELYQIGAITLSDQQPLLFFSALNKRNLYSLNIEDCIQQNCIQNFKKMRIPKKVTINHIKDHPFESKVFSACSDGYVRIQDYFNQQNAVNLFEPLDKNQKNVARASFNCLGFHENYLIVGTDTGKILIFKANNIQNNSNPFIKQIKASEMSILSIVLKNDKILFLQQNGLINQLSMGQDKNYEKTLFNSKSDLKPHLGQLIGMLPNFLQLSIFEILIIGGVYVKIQQSVQEQFQIKAQFFSVINQQSQKLVCASQIRQKLKDFYLNSQKQIFYQNFFIYADDSEIKLYESLDGKSKQLLNFKECLSQEHLTIKQIDFRPQHLENKQQSGTILINYHMEGQDRVCSMPINFCEESQNITNFKEFPCANGFYLGEAHLKNPPIFILNNDHHSITITIDSESEIDLEIKNLFQNTSISKIELNIRIKKCFQTPILNGFCVLFLSEEDNLLRFSKNYVTNDKLDLYVHIEGPYFKSSFDQEIQDVQFYNDGNKTIFAILCIGKLFFLNEKLEIINQISFQQLQTNYINKIQFIGATLFLQNQTHVYYCGILSNSIQIAFSFSNFIEANSLMGILFDRAIILQKSRIHSKFKQSCITLNRQFESTQCIVIGYIHLMRYYNSNENIEEFLTQIFRSIKTNMITKELLQELNELQFQNISHFLLGNDNLPQIYFNHRLDINKNLMKFDNFFSVLFPMKNVEDANDIVDLQKLLLLDPRYAFIQQYLKKYSKFFKHFGFYQQAAKCYQLVSDYKKLQNLLTKLNLKFEYDDPTNHLTFVGFQQHSSFKFDYKQIKNVDCLLLLRQCSNSKIQKLITNLQRKEIEISPLNFGEKLYYQMIKDSKGSIQQIEFLQNENLSQFLGYDSLTGSSVEKKQDFKIEQQDAGGFEDDEQQNQGSLIILYWRFDEAKGTITSDIGDLQNDGQIKCEFDPDWIPLEDSEPMEIEDKWGKKCPNQFAIGIDQNVYIESNNSLNGFDNIKNLSICFWLKPLKKDGIILSFYNQIFKFNIFLQNSQIQLQSNDQIINLQDDFQDQENVLKNEYWNYVSIQYCDDDSSIYIGVNCIQIQHVEQKDFLDNFRDINLLVGKGLQAEITEIRILKTFYSYQELKDGYKMPLEIVAEKKSKLKMKLKQKNKSNMINNNLNLFVGLLKPINSSNIPQKITSFQQINQEEENVKNKLKNDSQINYQTSGQTKEDFNQFSSNWGNQSSSNIQVNNESFSNFASNWGQPIEQQFGSNNDKFKFSEKQLETNRQTEKIPQIDQQQLKDDFAFANFREKTELQQQKIGNQPPIADLIQEQNSQSNQQYIRNESTFGDFGIEQKSEIQQSRNDSVFGNFGIEEKSHQDQIRNDSIFGNYGIEQKSQINQQQINNDSFFGNFRVDKKSQINNVQNNPSFVKFGEFETKSNINNDWNEDSIVNKKPWLNSDTVWDQNSGKPNKELFQQNQQNEQQLNNQTEIKQKIQENEPQIIQDDKILDKESIMYQEMSAILELFWQNYEDLKFQDSINMINKVFNILNKIIDIDGDSQKLSKYYNLCSNYRFSIEIIKGINIDKIGKNFRRDAFLNLILVHLNLKPNHRVGFILQAVEKNIQASNFSIACGLLKGLQPNLNKVKISQQQLEKFYNLQKQLQQFQMKNENLMKIQCPVCNDYFHFKGNNQCSKCNKQLYMCWQTLNCLSDSQILKCQRCCASFNKKIKQIGSQCPICIFGKLVDNN